MSTPPEQGMASLYRNLETATGKSIDQWCDLARNTGITKHKELVDHIKTHFGLTHGYAHQIALRALTAADAEPVDLVSAQYSGTKASLKPIYDLLVETIGGFGPDVEFSPKKAYVSIRRSRQFAILQPGAGRIDVGLVLKATPNTERLEASGSFNAMMTHRVRVYGANQSTNQSADQIDAELAGWLRAAYDAG